ncbi:MAG: GTPase ObgE [Mariprofundaceae bacterium]|nr:GTPase ObgE [Mariprofundaceae bacterium]
MRFIDEVSIEVHAGNGGAGGVSFRREKYIPKGGPDGGDGGRGGHVMLIASTRKNTLQELYLKKRLFAKNGQPGMGKDKHGRNGLDIEVEVPIGTMVRNEEGDLLADLNTAGERFFLARGGQGGLGNARFKTSTNRAPRYAQPGEPGEEGRRMLELKVMADVGLVGLPNAGKSTLLARISNAHPKVADYPFTTLKPMLGEVFTDDADAFVVADIPGLIEGAHEGKGLGMRFLRHVERTKLLLHLVDAASLSGAGIAEQLAEVEGELKGYGETVWHKQRLLVINKIDALDDALRQEVIAETQALNADKKLPVFMISAVTGEGVQDLMHATYAEVKKMREAKETAA